MGAVRAAPTSKPLTALRNSDYDQYISPLAIVVNPPSWMASLRYGSVCSGIEAATAAWHSLGWTPAFFSEIDNFPRAVLAHHYPSVPCHGDFTTIGKDTYDPIDLLVGGTPCQAFSVAGLRKGFADERGNLTLEFVRLAQRLQPRWLVWENVPGVLSIDGGRAFGSFLGGLAELGYGFAYRILDAQHFGVPQRRRRVFVVGYFGDWRPAAAVLFERESLLRDITPRRETREGTPVGFETGPHGGNFSELASTLDTRCKDGPIRNQTGTGILTGRQWPADLASTLNAHYGDKMGLEDQHAELFVPHLVGALTAKGPNALGAPQVDAGHYITHALRGEGFDASEDGTGRGTPLIPCMAFDAAQITSPTNRSHVQLGLPAPTISQQSRMHVAAFKGGQGAAAGSIGYDEHVSPTLNAADSGSNRTPALMQGMQVRRLTPRECERLQGFPDDYTLVPNRGKLAADGPRYKALGNSMAVPVMRHIGERIEEVEQQLGLAA